MKKIMLVALVSAVLGGTALAGYKMTSVVSIYGNRGSGNIADARAAANTTEHIGCNTFGWAQSTNSGYVFCWAVDAANKQLTCSSENPSIVHASSAIGGASYISFSVDKLGNCDTLDVQNHSYSPPSVP